MVNTIDWAKEMDASVCVCDLNGIVTYMNEKGKVAYGSDLTGKEIFSCHPEPAKTKFKALMASGKENIYSIEKNGVKKMVYDLPVYENGKFAGYAELVKELPENLPHYIRK
ncbi:MAG: hypothetical protein WCI43_07640 [Candidatus Firestonebacteria bacterium]